MNRAGLSIGEAADVNWATAGAEIFLRLTAERGWNLDTYERWLADTSARLLNPTRHGSVRKSRPRTGGPAT